jgi:hypothetical protein
MLSVLETPVSDAFARSGALGAAGAVLSMVIVVAELVAEVGPALALLLVTELADTLGIKVPSPQPVAVSVKDVPLVPLVEKLQLAAVPLFVRSSAPNPEIDSENSIEKVIAPVVFVEVGVLEVNEETLGGVIKLVKAT